MNREDRHRQHIESWAGQHPKLMESFAKFEEETAMKKERKATEIKKIYSADIIKGRKTITELNVIAEEIITMDDGRTIESWIVEDSHFADGESRALKSDPTYYESYEKARLFLL